MTAGALLKPDLADGLADDLAGANVMACLQCRKCTSGCPVAARADIKPHQLVRMIQLGQGQQVLASRMIWECTSCQTCITRCPQKVDIAAMNDRLRQICCGEGTALAGNAVATFNDVFLRSVRKRGRVYELGMMSLFKLRTGRFFDDAGKVPMMLAKRKLSLFPKTVAGRSGRKEMFRSLSQPGRSKP